MPYEDEQLVRTALGAQMILVRQHEPGLITIDFSQEPGFDVVTDGVLLTGGLFVRETTNDSIVVEEAGQPGPTVLYIQKTLESLGYAVSVASDLDRRVEAFLEEQHLIGLVRRSPRATSVDARLLRRLGLKRKLLEHQIRGVAHALAVRHAANFSVPGSGKTAVSLTVFAALKQSGAVERLMVIGPASSFVPWEEEFALTFGRRAQALRLIGSRQVRARLLQDLGGADLVLATYQMAHREAENLSRVLQATRFMLVLDESHHIKNIGLGPWATAALDLAPLAARRMILTGTPAPHSLRDLWSQFTFLWPSQGLLSDRVGFDQRVQGPDPKIDEVKKDLRPFFHRTKKSDLGLREPIALFTPISADDVPKRQRLIIRLLELRTIREAQEVGLDAPDVAILRRWRKARTIRLMQAASNPALLSSTAVELGDAGEPLGSDAVLADALANYHKYETPAKIVWVVDKVSELVARGRKVVVWATFVENLLLLSRQLSRFDPLMVYGGVPPYEEDSDPDFESRERNIREFKTDKDKPVLLANPAACAESISLHRVCHDAVYLERTFNCGQFLQSMDRIHRVGIPKSAPRTTYHIPLLPCAVEKVMDRRLKDRQRVLYELLDDDLPVVGLEEGSAMLEHEDDLDAIFHEVIQEIKTSAAKGARGAAVRGRSRR